MAEIISIKSDLRNQSGLEALITRLKAHSRVTNARTDEWYGNWSLLLEYVNRPSIEDEKAYHRIKSKGRGYLSNVLKRIGPKPAIDSISINKIEASYKPFQDIFIVEIKNRFAGEFDDMEFEQFLSWLKSVSVFGAKTIAHKPEDSKIYPPPLELLYTVWYMYHYQYSRSNRHERPRNRNHKIGTLD
ncbi:MAG: hypothetical protein IPN95_31020 [Bacteroidetes bacterium]|nr:hypothetical protein [Bacteroidota bacterium]